MRVVLIVLLALAPLAAAQSGLEQTREAQAPAEAETSPEGISTLVGNPWAWAVVAGVVLVVGLAIALARTVRRSRRA